jgi:DNA uptake protein ComE-like DNA-binding protein
VSAHRRGFVLLAVLILVGAAVLAATGVVFLVRGEVAGSGNAAESTRLRAAGWSAVQAVAARLGSERARILAGESPRLERKFFLWEAAGENATATLLPVGPSGELVVAEGAKIPLATATVESLVATGVVDDALAARVIAARDAAGPVLDVDALLLVRGPSALRVAELYGPVEEMTLDLDADARIRSGEALAALLGGGIEPRGLADLLTVHGADPPLTADGSPRLVIGEWTAEQRRAVDAALGAGSATLLAGAVEESAESPPSDARSAWNAWRARYPDPREWAAFLDRIDLRPAGSDERIDVIRASAAALRAVPGIDDERAARIVRERDALSAEDRRTAAWLAQRGILEPDAFAAVAERLTTRSLSWRFRVAARIYPERRFGSASAPEEDQPVRVAVYEAIVDLSEPEPRIAYLREIAALEVAAMLLASLDDEDEVERAEAPVARNEAASPRAAPAVEPMREPASEPAAESAAEPARAVGAPRRVGRFRGLG